MANCLTGVAGVLIEDQKILLVKRRNPPKQGLWCIPCGKVDRGESPEQAMIREFNEETHLDVKIISQVHHSTKSYHPDIIYTGTWYLVERVSGTLQADDDAEEAEFFGYSELPELAFDEDMHVISSLFADDFASAD
jgi:ADP-ribose pyrophosphatase YjhB (NUDIX family)